jgi:hypothetical protein
MTTHLSDSEFVDFAERRLGADRSAHLDDCPRCRAEAEEIRLTLEGAAAVDVPEPSPLFWDHLSARVREELASAPAPHRSPWRRPIAALAWATAIALVAVITVRQLPRPISPSPPPSPVGGHAAIGSPAEEPPIDVPPNDAAWALLGAAASHMELDEAHAAGLTVRPSAVDKGVLDLNPAEQDALAHLLQDELKRAGA